MVYQNKVVAVVKNNGKVLREDNGTVYLPFGAEYSILVKNLDSVRIKFRIFIDGKDATGWIIGEPNSSVNMERFIKNNNLDSGNRFKFIERTEEIENHRGVGAEDGLIRIEYQREIVYNQSYTFCNGWQYNNGGNWYNSAAEYAEPCIGGIRGKFAIGSTYYANSSSANMLKCSETSLASNDKGITVPGSISDQKFVQGSWFMTGVSEYIILHLKGGKKPVTVDADLVCITCGKRSKSSQKYCGNCGTSLRIV